MMKSIFSTEYRFDRTILFFVIGVFVYTLISSLVFQLIIFPHLPSISTPYGILKGDNELFHKLAVTMSNEIIKNGWDAWKLFPMGTNAAGINVGVVAALYSLFGVKPFLVLPLNALLHTSSFYLFFRIFIKISNDKWLALLASIPFVIMPSTLLWTSQLHKDNYAILAWAFLFYSVFRLKDGSFLELICTSSIALFFLLIVRPLYLNLTLIISLIIFIGYVSLYLRKKLNLKNLINPLVLLLMTITFFTFFTMWNPIYGSKDETHFYISEPSLKTLPITKSTGKKIGSCENYQWINTFFPNYLEDKIRAIAGIRLKQLCFVDPGATSTVDANFLPSSFKELFLYIPRALEISIFYPTPYQLFKINNIKSFPVLFEMVIFYFFIPFAIWYLWKNAKIDLLTLVFTVLFCECFLAYIIPNMGSYHRIRYPFFSFLFGLGLLSFLDFIRWRKDEKK